MSTLNAGAEAIKEIGEAALGAPWVWQFAAWRDDKGPAGRYAVIKPSGSVRAVLVRKPVYTVALIGGEKDAPGIASEASQTLAKAMRNATHTAFAGAVVSEPVFSGLSGEGRVIFEVVVDLTISFN